MADDPEPDELHELLQVTIDGEPSGCRVDEHGDLVFFGPGAAAVEADMAAALDAAAEAEQRRACSTCGKVGCAPVNHRGWHPDDEKR